mmetsp:Transcript_24485/g.35338  ORF Transcript_24485/g.35338 Transcript_24485/m.35338 type:complete len:137 (+) Transcript_24485:1350-1760(+)
MELLKVKQNLSTACHPQTDGQTERINQTLETYLRCNSAATTWANDLRVAELTYNRQISESTEFSPFELFYGHNPTVACEVTLPRPETTTLLPEAAEVLTRQQKDILDIAKVNLCYANQKHGQAAKDSTTLVLKKHS